MNLCSEETTPMKIRSLTCQKYENVPVEVQSSGVRDIRHLGMMLLVGR